MNKSRFSLYTLDYPPNRGGVSAYLFGLVSASGGGIIVHAAIDRWFWKLWPHWLPLVWKMRQERQSGRIVLASHVFPVGTAAWLSRIAGGPEYGVIFHGLDIRNARSRWKRFLLRGVCRQARVLITNSGATKRDLIELVGEAGRGAEVFYPALTTVQMDPGSESGMEKKITVLSIARFIPRKGIDNAIRAMKGVDARYVVIGDGPDCGRLKTIARQEGVHAEFLGEVSEDVKRQWLGKADVFLLPVRDEGDDVEGFGIVFLEAAAAGVASVAGRSGGAVEAVKDGETGILVDPEDVNAIRGAVLDLIHDTEKRVSMGKLGKEWAQSFSWAENWRRLSAIGHPMSNNEIWTSDVQTGESGISIVIPCFNHAYILRRTFQGILAQTIPIKEIVVVDDGSSDHPERVVERFQDWLPIRVVRLDNNRGAPYARNVGANETSGRYILFLDADAELEPDALEKMEAALRDEPGASYAYSNFLWGSKAFRGIPFREDALKRRNFIHTSSLIRRDDFPGFDESLKKFQDWDLWLTMLERGKRGVWVDDVLYRIEPRGKEGMSRWVPRILHRIPWDWIGIVPHEIQKYREAERIVKSKHGLL